MTRLVRRGFAVSLRHCYFSGARYTSYQRGAGGLLLFGSNNYKRYSGHAYLTRVGTTFLGRGTVRVTRRRPSVVLYHSPCYAGRAAIRHLVTSNCSIRAVGDYVTFPGGPVRPRVGSCSGSRSCRSTLGRRRRRRTSCVRVYGRVDRQYRTKRVTLCTGVNRTSVALYCIRGATTRVTRDSGTARAVTMRVTRLRGGSGHGGRVTARGAMSSMGEIVGRVSAARAGFNTSRSEVVCFFLLSSLHGRGCTTVNVSGRYSCLGSRSGVGIVTGLATGTGTVVHESFLVTGFGSTFEGGNATTLLFSFTGGRVPRRLTGVAGGCGGICRGHRGHVRRGGITLLRRAGRARRPRSRRILRPARRRRPRITTWVDDGNKTVRPLLAFFGSGV